MTPSPSLPVNTGRLVLATQGDTVRVLHRLRPIGVAMAGADTYDPFKD